jgi:hypothetical protein
MDDEVELKATPVPLAQTLDHRQNQDSTASAPLFVLPSTALDSKGVLEFVGAGERCR